MTSLSCSSTRSLRLALATIGALLLLQSVTFASGGVCWSAINNAGRCKEILSQGVTREQCCNSHNNQGINTAYSEEDYDNGALFFWQVLGGGVTCDSCRSTCQGITCKQGKVCVLRRGMPKCVCRPAQCSSSTVANNKLIKKQEYDGPVCGTDGRTYSNVCKLKRRSCRKGDDNDDDNDNSSAQLTVAYGGQCRSSCLGVRCRHGRSCLLDQNLSAHCVKCSRRCTLTAKQSAQLNKPVCGVDGQTYKSACHLRAAACRAGRAIAIAYRGPCRKQADCRSIECRTGQLCLTEPETLRPRCVTCLYRCPRNKELVQQRNRHKNRDYQDSTPLALCATNNITYPSWCHIMKDACLTGMVIETRHAGACDKDDLAASADWKTTTTTTTISSMVTTPRSNSNSSISTSLTIIDTKENNNPNKLKLKKDLKTIIGKSQSKQQTKQRKATAASTSPTKKKNKQQKQPPPSVL